MLEREEEAAVGHSGKGMMWWRQWAGQKNRGKEVVAAARQEEKVKEGKAEMGGGEQR